MSSVWGVLISFLECFSLFSHPPLPFFTIFTLLLLSLLFYFYSLLLLLLSPWSSWLCVTGAWAGAGCGGRGLVPGLRAGLACGVLLLPGFGVSSSSPQVPGHPTSTCDAGVNCREHLKYVWNVYFDVTNHMRDLHTTEATEQITFVLFKNTNCLISNFKHRCSARSVLRTPSRSSFEFTKNKFRSPRNATATS